MAQEKTSRDVIEELRRSIPDQIAPQAPGRDVYLFDRETYTWVCK